MNIQSQLMQIIKTALSSHDNLTRSQAESQIIMYKDSNPTEFYFNCAQILQNQNNEDFVRQSTGTVMSRLLVMKNMNTGKFSWDEIYKEQKDQIREKVLSVLISPKVGVMRAGALVIAAIASIDLPKGQWTNIVDVLGENCNNADPNFKNASITTLGFICEQIRNMGHRISDRLSEQILGAIIIGTRQTQPYIIQTSLKALQDSLFFLESMMSNLAYRNTVFEVFINNFKNDIFVQRTYRALFEFVRAASPYLGCYKKQFTDLTEIHLEKRNGTSIFNLEMWEIIGSGYADKFIRTKDRVNEVTHEENFLQLVSEQVLPNIMKCLLILNKKEEDQEEFRNSASKALESFVKVCDKSVIDTISSSVVSIINSQDPYYQQASVPLFSTISEYSDHYYAQEMFRNGFQHLFGLLNSQNKIVVKNSIIGFIRLSEAFPEVFLLNSNIQQIMLTFFNFMNVDVKDVRIISAIILCNICEGLKENPKPVADDPSILLTKVVNYFTTNKLKFLEEQIEVNEKLAGIIMSIVMSSSNTNVIVHLIQFMIDEYYKIVNLSLPNISSLIDLILSILHTSILAFKNAISSHQLLNKLCDLINFHVKKIGYDAQGLAILSSIATSFGKNFEGRIQNYLPGVKKTLQNPNDVTTYKNALACIGDFARVMEGNFFNHASQIINSLLQNMKQSYDRQVKLSILICTGDLVLSLQQDAVTYLQDILKIMDLCFSATYQLLNNDKDLEYVQELKTNLIELYSCVSFALNKNSKALRLFSNHFGLLATFIVRTCDKSLNPTVDYLKNCIYLIHDIASFMNPIPQYKQNARNIIESSQIQQLQNMLAKYQSNKEIKELFSFIQSAKNR